MATIQELLENRSGGAQQARSDVSFLLKLIRENMKREQQKDKDRAVAASKAGKIGLEGIKTRKDYLLARRGNPELTFKDFLLNPDVAGKSMERGVSNIVAGQSPEINLREFFGIGDGGDYRTVQMGDFQSANRGPTTTYSGMTARESMLGNLNPNLKLNTNLQPFETQTPPPPMVSDEGLQKTLTAGQIPISQMGQGVGVNRPTIKPRPVGDGSLLNPIQMEQIDVMPAPPATESSSALGSAGSAIGTGLSALSAGRGLFDIGTKRLTPSNTLTTAGAGISLIPGGQLIGPAIATLGSLLSRNKYYN
jgi:hypothetical protein